MVQRFLLSALLIFPVLTSFSQTGKTFPSLTGEILEGGTRSLPADYKGKLTLVGMAWSKKAEETLATWYQPVYDKFVAKLGMMDDDYDVQICLVPMYIGLKQTAYDATLKELRESNRKDLFPYILFYKGPLEPYEQALGLKDNQLPYFFLLDENGKVIYATSGLFSESKMEKLEEAISGH